MLKLGTEKKEIKLKMARKENIDKKNLTIKTTINKVEIKKENINGIQINKRLKKKLRLKMQKLQK
jgi:hypothetical protein